MQEGPESKGQEPLTGETRRLQDVELSQSLYAGPHEVMGGRCGGLSRRRCRHPTDLMVSGLVAGHRVSVQSE